MTPQARLLTLLAGATALLGLTYGFGRLALRPRSPATASVHGASVAQLAGSSAAAEAWESALIAQSAPADALDLALDLDGTFDATADETSGVTVRSSDRVPHASSGDDADPPSPDDLGRAWLYQATQSERSFTEADLDTELDNLAAQGDDASEPLEDDERTSYA